MDGRPGVHEALLQRWVAALGSSGPVVAAGRDVLARYAEPHRRYHDLQHLAELLRALDLLTAGQVPRTVLWAAYWHDAVYDPAAADNEVRSAELAARALAGPAPELRDEVVRLVELTAGHDPAPGDAPGALLCDADLWVLASPPARYDSYARAVREEYAHVAEPDFRRGRAQVLGGLLSRPQLYSTPQGRSRWEQAARRNAQAELDRLTGAGPGAGPPA